MNRHKVLSHVLAAIGALMGILLVIPPSIMAETDKNNDIPQIYLREGWRLQSSRTAKEGGEVISSSEFETQGWYPVTVPSTVVAAQVAAGEFKDPYFGMDLREYPGMSYPIGYNTFSNLPMEKDSPYAVSWWYRTEFQVPQSFRARRVWLQFKGINYRANLWINGRKVADSKDVAGAYHLHEFDVTSFVDLVKRNVLAVEVFAPTEKDLGINWVDWNPTPPDKNMGIWGDVCLTATGPVSVRYPMVATHFTDDSLKQADLTVTAQLSNASNKAVRGELEAELLGTQIRQEVELQPGETRSVSFTSQRFAELRVKNPNVWWPAEMGTPALQNLGIGFFADGVLSDEQSFRFGIREVTSELTQPAGYRLFRINGKKILIRGGAWTMDMLLRPLPAERFRAEFQYIRDLHLNTIRLEGQLGSDELFDMADQNGIFIMAGWCCCDMWEKWDKWTDSTLHVATESLRTQALRMRGHASLLVWLNGSDGPPPTSVERVYLKTLKEASWPNPIVSSAGDFHTAITGTSGVKMTGPYEYEPPSYWLLSQSPGPSEKLRDARYGGAFGYNTETGPGPAIPPLQCLRKMFPSDHLWPIDKFWEFHGAGERFMKLERFRAAMNATYGAPRDLNDFLLKAQAMAYDGERAMFEAYGRNKFEATGVIHWMLNNAWPSTYWHLYDYYLYPAGGYFGAKKANEPLHVQYSYDDRSVVVVNNRLERFVDLTVDVQVFDVNLRPAFSREVKITSEPDRVTTALSIPAFPLSAHSELYFVKLALRNAGGKLLSSNFYWLPAQLSTIDWQKAAEDTDHAPIASYEDLTALNQLPRVQLEATAELQRWDRGDEVRLTLHNPSENLAFQVHLGVRNASSEDEILPVLWEDNYIALMPGESKELTARYLAVDLIKQGATVLVDGWNIEPVTVSVERRTPSAPPSARVTSE